MSKTHQAIGKVYFHPRGDQFVRVTAVELKPSLPDSNLHIMTYKSLKDGYVGGANFVEEIGEEFYPLPDDFPAERISAYHAAANASEKATAVMLEIEHEVLLND